MHSGAGSERPVFDRGLLFVNGKGGVGKTVLSQAIALRLNQLGRRVLWATFEDPVLPLHELREVKPGLFHLNCEPAKSFEEYATMKIGVAGLARIFLQNNVVRYLAKAAPGIRELVLLGKVWHERANYDCVVVDMPSTGYALAMFQSTRNFARLFQGGPIHRDTDEMLATFNDPKQTAQLVVSLPEEMPLRESLELKEHLERLFPKNPPVFLANRLFPQLGPGHSSVDPDPDRWSTPVSTDGADYAAKRHVLETSNLKVWDEAGLSFLRIGYEPPVLDTDRSKLISGVAAQLRERGYL